MRTVYGNKNVLANLFAQSECLCRTGDVLPGIKPGLLGGPGLELGVNGAAYLRAFEERGLMCAFNVVGAVSTSIPTMAFFLAGQTALVENIYTHECPTTQFYDRARLKEKQYPMDVDFLGTLFQSRLNQVTLRASRPKFEAIVRRTIDEQVTFFDVKKDTRPDTSDIVDLLCAGIAVPRWSRGSVPVNDVLFGDANPAFPIEDFASRHSLTDLVVILNHPLPEIGDPTWGNEMATGLQGALLQTQCRVVVIAGEDDEFRITPFERSAQKMLGVAKNAKGFMANVLGEYS